MTSTDEIIQIAVQNGITAPIIRWTRALGHSVYVSAADRVDCIGHYQWIWDAQANLAQDIQLYLEMNS
jgi:hypothetical protein